jgi:hypothetical protein
MNAGFSMRIQLSFSAIAVCRTDQEMRSSAGKSVTPSGSRSNLPLSPGQTYTSLCTQLDETVFVLGHVGPASIGEDESHEEKQNEG